MLLGVRGLLLRGSRPRRAHAERRRAVKLSPSFQMKKKIHNNIHLTFLWPKNILLWFQRHLFYNFLYENFIFFNANKCQIAYKNILLCVKKGRYFAQAVSLPILLFDRRTVQGKKGGWKRRRGTFFTRLRLA
jgi:hypothetical protein